MKGRIQTMLMAWKEGFSRDSRYWVLSALIACICCPAYNLIYASGIDESLFWTFNYFADGHFDDARDVIFPHGPLAFLLYPVTIGNNIVVAIVVHLSSAFLFSLNLFRLHRSGETTNPAFVTLIAVFLLSFLDLQMILVGLTITHILIHSLNGKHHLTVAIFLSVLNLFIKTYGGVLCFLILAGKIVHLFITRENKDALLIIVQYVAFFFGAWLLMFHTFEGALTFLRGQIELASDNSEAVSFNQYNNWWLIALCLVALAVSGFLVRNPLAQQSYFLMLLPLFAAWKHAMARGEEHHVGGFLNILILFFFILWTLFEYTNKRLLIAGLVSICAFFLSMSVHGNWNRHESLGPIKIHNLYNYVFNYHSLLEEKQKESDNYVAHLALPDSILNLIGDHTVDIYPWNYAIVAKNNLHWVPRPVLNSYAAYTEWLDARDAEHFDSEKSPRFMIWELTDLDQNGNLFESIDGRYILNDEPKALVRFFSNYNLKLKTSKYLIYEKRQIPLVAEVAKEIPVSAQTFDTWIEVPADSSVYITRAKIEIDKTFKGLLKSWLYKGEIFHLYYELENGKVYSHRIVPKSAEDGLWLNPFVIYPERESDNSKVSRIKLVCSDRRMVKDQFNISFEQITLSHKNDPLRVTKIRPSLFQQNDKVNPFTLFYSSAKAGTIINSYGFTEGAKIIQSSESLSGKSCYELPPGTYSGHFTFNPDSSMQKFRFLNIRFEGYVKTSPNSKAVFIVAQDKKPWPIYWTKTMNEMVDDPKCWTYVYFTNKVPLIDIDLNLPITFNVWNQDGKEKLLLDDLTVTVEGSFE